MEMLLWIDGENKIWVVKIGRGGKVFCKYCGNEFSENTKFCTKCGKMIISEPLQSKVNTFEVNEIIQPKMKKLKSQGW